MHFGDRLRQERLRHYLSQEALAEALNISARSIRRWEQGHGLPHMSIRLQLSRFFGLSPEAFFEDEEPQDPNKPLWTIPYPRNPFFTGREEILTRLHILLSLDESVAFPQMYALQGLAGVGKTHIALEYAYRYAQEYRAIFWVGSETTESMLFDLQRVAELLHLPQWNSEDPQRIRTAVLRWLTTHDRWLLMCDNVDNLSVLDNVLPSVGHGAVLLTTQLQALGTRAQGISLVPLEQEEGMLLLLRRAKALHPQATSEHMQQLSIHHPVQYKAAAELVTTMGGLPLALDQAGAYLEETQCGLPAYLDLFRTRRAALLQQRGKGESPHPVPVSTTFELAITATTQRHPAVHDLLRVCALLQPESIPEEIFRLGAKQLGARLEAAAHDQLDWNQMLAVACSSSLLSRQAEAQTFSMHRLVQAILLETMSETERQTWTLRVIEALDALFPALNWMDPGQQSTREHELWKKQCERLVPHALICIHRAGERQNLLALASLASKVARYVYTRGQFGEAEPLLQRALRIRERVLGLNHSLIEASLHELASLYWNQGRYAEEEPLLRRALSIGEHIHEADDPDLVKMLNDLALLYWRQGKYTEAEPLYQRALHIREQAQIPDDILLAHLLNHLALLYWSQGKYPEAEPLYQRALLTWEQIRGPDHYIITYTLNNLAQLYRTQGRYTEAEPLYRRALQIREHALGLDHPDVATILNNLAELAQEQNRYAEAETLYQRALQIREQTLDSCHPLVAETLNGVANLLCCQCKYEEAEQYYQRALYIREQRLGLDHPETAQTLHDLALFFQQRSDTRQALSLAERALNIRSQSLGEAHPETVASRRLYAQLMQQQGGAE